MSALYTTDDFKHWGAAGGKKSRRLLSRREASKLGKRSAMVRSGQLIPESSPKKVHGTYEWAVHCVNIQTGCEHSCLYCYAKSMSIRHGQSTPASWEKPRIRKHDVERRFRKLDGRVMFPTSHDITELNLGECIRVLEGLLDVGNEVLIVTKPHLKCVEALCEHLESKKNRVMFRFTIGSADDAVLGFWEPDAPTYKERIRSLVWAYQHGYKTSVSAEPMLDDGIQKVILDTKPYVTDSIWLGRANQLRARVSLNCPRDSHVREKAETLLALHSDQWVTQLFEQYRHDPLVKYKDSIKKVVGLVRPVQSGLDI